MSDWRAPSLKPPRPLLNRTIYLAASTRMWSRATIWTVTVIDADSRRMTVRWVLFPFPKGGLVLRALGCMGLLLMPRSLGCCGESGSLSQCIRYDADVLWGVHDWSSRPAARRSCVCACAAACLRRGKSVRMACVLWTRNHKKDLRAPRWCQIPWPSGHMANTQPTCGVCVCVSGQTEWLWQFALAAIC